MDITPQDSTLQPISDDQELAKALAGVLPEEPAPAAADTSLQFEETPATPAIPGAVLPQPEQPAAPTDLSNLSTASVAPVAPVQAGDATGSSALSDIKSSALNALRPLIGKVDLPAEEKFDTYLMLIRSTDDTSLIEPAHAAAQGIADEKRKAEALLDIIKEIDYLSRKDQ